MYLYQIDAFTDKIYGGNPAAVCPLDFWPTDALMQKIAAENNLSETAFFLPSGDQYELRWFTPTLEVNLCGHATLAAAHVIFHHLDYEKEKVIFTTKSGNLTVSRLDHSRYLMQLPSDPPEQIHDANIGKIIGEGLHQSPIEIWKGKEDYLAILDSQSSVINLKPDFSKLAMLDARGIITTAKGDDWDFVSRCFYPQSGIDEDPTTGSAHTTLTPYWANRLRKNRMTAAQLSSRKGLLECIYKGEHTLLIGSAVSYLKGEILT